MFKKLRTFIKYHELDNIAPGWYILAALYTLAIMQAGWYGGAKLANHNTCNEQLEAEYQLDLKEQEHD